MIELVGQCGDRFDRLALSTQWVTCVFLVAVLLLSGGGLLIRRGQNIGAAERAQQASLDAEAAALAREQERARHDVRFALPPLCVLAHRSAAYLAVASRAA